METWPSGHPSSRVYTRYKYLERATCIRSTCIRCNRGFRHAMSPSRLTVAPAAGTWTMSVHCPNLHSDTRLHTAMMIHCRISANNIDHFSLQKKIVNQFIIIRSGAWCIGVCVRCMSAGKVACVSCGKRCKGQAIKLPEDKFFHLKCFRCKGTCSITRTL